MLSQEKVEAWLKEYATTTPEEAVSEWLGSYEDNLRHSKTAMKIGSVKMAWGLYRSELVPAEMKAQLADAIDKILDDIDVE